MQKTSTLMVCTASGSPAACVLGMFPARGFGAVGHHGGRGSIGTSGWAGLLAGPCCRVCVEYFTAPVGR